MSSFWILILLDIAYLIVIQEFRDIIYRFGNLTDTWYIFDGCILVDH